MRFLSLFSGIEAATCAWEPLGWECAAVAEVESFPCALLKHHYPEVPNLGDVTKITADQINALGHIDLVCGGFPCQDLSVAGKRKGLNNADGTSTRSGLFFDAMRIADWANPRWLFVENVPGMFSSNSGRDFAAVVGEMAGCEFAVPRDGWRNAGVVVGPRGLVEWSVMDAQYHGLAQRRKRVFIVRDSGDWANRPPIFLESYRLQGHPAPRRQAGQRPTGTLSARTEGGGGLGTDFELGGGLQPVGTLCAATGQAGAEICAEMAPTLNCNHEAPYVVYTPAISATLVARSSRGGGQTNSPGHQADHELVVTHTLRGEGFDASEDGTGRGTPLVPVLPFDTTQITSAANYSNPKAGDPCHPLAAQAHVPAIAFAHQAGGMQTTLGYDPACDTAPTLAKCQTLAVHSAMQVRRLTPGECESLQGFPQIYTNVLHRGKPAADGPRYKSLGNSWAVPNVRWIGQRIDAVALINKAQAATNSVAELVAA